MWCTCLSSVRHECVRERPGSAEDASSFALLDHGTKVEPTSRGNVKVMLAQKPGVVLHVLNRARAASCVMTTRRHRSIVPKYVKRQNVSSGVISEE